MSAEAVGRHFPAVVTLDDVAAMNAADRYGHRYELNPQGALSVMPPPDSEHAAIASRVLVWLAVAGWPAEQLLQAAGVRIPGSTGFRRQNSGPHGVEQAPAAERVADLGIGG